jgi:UDP-N-acetylglucosamine 4,6-dehydratase
MDLARVIGPECEHEIIGIRPGEKLHETLVSEDDARLTIELDDRFVIQPIHSYWNKHQPASRGGKLCADGFRYSSDTNVRWLTDKEILELVSAVQSDPGTQDQPSPTEPRLIVGG